MPETEEDFHLHEIIERLELSIGSGVGLAKSFKHPRALHHYLRQLDTMVGMGRVKSLVVMLVCRHAVAIHDKTEHNDHNDTMNHILLLGSPGSGKSTISELLSNVICAIGFLKTPGPEILKELEEGEQTAPKSNESVLISAREMRAGQLVNAMAEINKGAISDLKDRIASLTRRISNVSVVSRTIHDEAAELTAIINTSLVSLGGGEISPIPQIPGAGQGSTELVNVLRRVSGVISNIRMSADRLLIMSHVTDLPMSEQRVVEHEEPPTPVPPPIPTVIEPEADFKPRYVQASRSDLVGRFVGQTAPKVKACVAKALGGVLFIDEAYAMVNHSNGEPESFSMEFLNTLCGLMSKYSEYFVCNWAGYAEETIKAANTNRGMLRRFAYVLTLEDYTAAEVEAIFRQQLSRSGLSVAPDLDLADFIRRHKDVMGSTGAVSNQLTGICANIYARQRFRLICEGRATPETRGQVDLDILEKGLIYIKNNITTMHSTRDSLPPDSMYI